MKKVIFFALTAIIMSVSVLRAQTVDVKIEYPPVAEPGQEFEIKIKINKGDIGGFARFQVDFPEGFTVKSTQPQGATFSFKENKARFLWMSLPSETEININCIASTNNSGLQEFEGTFSYVVNNETQRTAFPKQSITIGGTAVAQNDVKTEDVKSNDNSAADAEKLEAERKAREAANAKAEEERKEREEAERLRKEEEAAQKAREEAIEKEKAEKTEDVVVQENEEIIKESEQERIAREEAELIADEKKQAEIKAREEAEKAEREKLAREAEEQKLAEAVKETETEVETKKEELTQTEAENVVVDEEAQRLEAEKKAREEATARFEAERIAREKTEKEQRERLEREAELKKQQEATALEATKEVVKSAPAATAATGVDFRVQVGASREAAESGFYNKLNRGISEFKVVEVNPYDGWYRYTMGSFGTVNEAQSLLGRVKSLGFEGFVTAFKDGKRITIQEAKKIKGQQ